MMNTVKDRSARQHGLSVGLSFILACDVLVAEQIETIRRMDFNHIIGTTILVDKEQLQSEHYIVVSGHL
jgi:hypothetical protein